MCDHSGERHEITISNVLYVKEMNENLRSYAKVTNENKIVWITEKSSEIYNKLDVSIGIAFKEYGSYEISSFLNKKFIYNVFIWNSTFLSANDAERKVP